MAFVFYHKFMWLKSRLQQSEKERQSLEEDNRLFKLEFGDRINSLQLEVDQLTKQRGQLELELKRERERRLRSYQGMPENRSLHSHNKGFQKTRSKIDAEDRCLEGDYQQHTSVNEANARLSSKGTQNLQEEHEQPLGSEKLQLCQLCKEESTRNKSKNICKNCGGIFCEDCSANELPLPSSINPERVCNRCHKRLIEQYSASPS